MVSTRSQTAKEQLARSQEREEASQPSSSRVEEGDEGDEVICSMLFWNWKDSARVSIILFSG
ncbi:hypothetical protein LINGRAHAP2_LOCUS10775, partial [Linum grandiflorum]